MKRNNFNSQGYKLESQIREAYTKVNYSQILHNKFINKKVVLDDRIKIFQIMLSAITTSGFILTIFSNDKVSSIIGAIISLILLILNTYIKSYNISNIVQEHKKAANSLWKIKEEYLSLLIDFEILDIKEIMLKRNQLQEQTSKIYSEAPNIKNFRIIKKSVKIDKEQILTENEIDMILPDSIRRCNRKMIDNDNMQL